MEKTSAGGGGRERREEGKVGKVGNNRTLLKNLAMKYFKLDLVMTKKGNQKQEKEKEKEVILKYIFACNIITRASNHFLDSLRKYKRTKRK